MATFIASADARGPTFDLRDAYRTILGPAGFQSPTWCHPILDMLLAPDQASLKHVVGSDLDPRSNFHGDDVLHRFIVVYPGVPPPPEYGEFHTNLAPFHYCRHHRWVQADRRGFAKFKCLGHPKEVRNPGSPFCRALALTAIGIYQALVAQDINSNALWPAEHSTPGHPNQETLWKEAVAILQYLVEEGQVRPERDLRFILESFGWTLSLPIQQQQWCSKMLVFLIREGLSINATDPGRLQALSALLEQRVKQEPDMYPAVDVRAWPLILKSLLNLAPERIREIVVPDAFRNQILLQLCMRVVDRAEGDRLEAALILSELSLQEHCFGVEDFLEVFNHPRFRRSGVLVVALGGATWQFKQAVLGQLDDMVQINDDGWRAHEQLLQGIIKDVEGDIRWCPSLCFSMRRDWILDRLESMSVEQICDYIESDENHADLLHSVVNRLVRLASRFQAGKILARRMSQNTPVFENLRNDPVIHYVQELYAQVDPLPDRFGPIEEGCLQLPTELGAPNFLYLGSQQEAEAALPKIAQDLGLNMTSALPSSSAASAGARVVGLAWQWLCFDSARDFWSRASIVCLAYEAPSGESVFVAIELLMLSELDHDGGIRVAEECKSLLRQLLEAHHILKVVHNMTSLGLRVLQRSVAPRDSFYCKEQRVRLEPFLDTALLVAFAQSTTPSDPACRELARPVREYLRIELCCAEVLGNPEVNGPRRLTQIHYALTTAWSPLMIARALCGYDITAGGPPRDGYVCLDEAKQLIFSGPIGGSDWHDELWSCRFEGAHMEDLHHVEQSDAMREAPICQDLWFKENAEAKKFRESLPTPRARDRLAECLTNVRAGRFAATSPLHLHLDAILRCLGNPFTTRANLETFYRFQTQDSQVTPTGDSDHSSWEIVGSSSESVDSSWDIVFEV